MGIATYSYNRSTSGGEIIRELVNATDGQGLHFDGAAGTYVDCSDTTILDGATKISLEAIASTSGTSMGTFIAKASAADGINLRFNADGKIFCALNNSTSTVSATTSGTYNDGNPKHIVATWDNATISIYVNGNLDGTATLAGGSIPNTTDRLALGANVNSGGTSSNNFDGILYRARLFNYVIDPTRFYENSTVPFSDQYGSQTDLVTNGTFTGGITGWNVASITYNTNKVDWAANPGGWAYIRQTTWTLTKGKKYRLTFDVSNHSADGVLHLMQYSIQELITTLDSITGNGTVTHEFTALNSSIGGVLFGILGSSFAGTMDDVSCVEIGCVSDYDLAFANPTQSTMVQDRAGAADGTSSASGVTQVTPIEQLNSKSARIGTSAATPADGELVAQKVTVNDTTAGSGWNTIGSFQRLGDEVLAVRSNGDNLILLNNDTAGYIGFAAGSGGGTRLIIDSAGNSTFAGNVGVGVTPVTPLQVNGAAGFNLCVDHESGSVRAIALNDAGNTFVPIAVGGSTVQLRTGASQAAALIIDSAGTVSTSSTASEALKLDSSNAVGSYQTWKNSTASVFYVGNRNAVSASQATNGDGTDLWATSGRGIAFFTNGTTPPRLNISSAGEVTMPTTPAFSASPSVAQDNLAVGTSVDIVLGTEIFDQGANFASNTFTAPVAGRYQLNAILGLVYIDSAADFYQVQIATSNRTYTYTFDPDFGQDAVYWEFGPSVLADMDASDTAVMRFFQSGGTAQTDVSSVRTYFNGYLAC